MHGVFRPGHGVPAIPDDIFGVLINGASGLCQSKSTVAAVKELYTEGFFQQVDLLDDRRGRNVAFFGSFVEAARIRYTEKSF